MATSSWVYLPRSLPRALPCDLTTNQSEEVTYPAAFRPKSFHPKSLGSSGFLSISHSFSLLGPAVSLSLPQTPMFQFNWPHCALDTQTFITSPLFFQGTYWVHCTQAAISSTCPQLPSCYACVLGRRPSSWPFFREAPEAHPPFILRASSSVVSSPTLLIPWLHQHIWSGPNSFCLQKGCLCYESCYLDSEMS